MEDKLCAHCGLPEDKHYADFWENGQLQHLRCYYSTDHEIAPSLHQTSYLSIRQHRAKENAMIFLDAIESLNLSDEDLQREANQFGFMAECTSDEFADGYFAGWRQAQEKILTGLEKIKL